MKTANEVFYLLSKYQITLQPLPIKEVNKYVYKLGEAVNPTTVRIEKERLREANQESFDRYYKGDRSLVVEDGVLYRYFQICHTPGRGGWIAKVSNRGDNIQKYGRETKFWDQDPEKAIDKAIEHVKLTVLSDEVTV